MFDKNRYYKSVWDWFFKFFFEKLRKSLPLLKNPFTDFQEKTDVHRKNAYILVCPLTSRVFFCFSIFSTGSIKSVGGKMTDVFYFFIRFLKN